MNRRAVQLRRCFARLGHDVLAVAEAMPQAEDAAILARAVQESANRGDQ